MSDIHEETKSIARDIVAREMVIGPQDADAVEKFFDHFNMTMPEELKESMKAFKKNPNIKTQKKFVIEVNRAISGEHSIDALDEMFKPIVECAKETAYELEFSDEVEEMLDTNLQSVPEELKTSQTSELEEPSDS